MDRLPDQAPHQNSPQEVQKQVDIFALLQEIVPKPGMSRFFSNGTGEGPWMHWEIHNSPTNVDLFETFPLIFGVFGFGLEETHQEWFNVSQDLQGHTVIYKPTTKPHGLGFSRVDASVSDSPESCLAHFIECWQQGTLTEVEAFEEVNLLPLPRRNESVITRLKEL